MSKSILKMLALITLLFALLMPYKIYAEERLDVPLLRQIWSPWGKETIGFSDVDLIENNGCALTTLSMLLRYYGVDTDPYRLNAWLKENGGYAGRYSIVWSKILELSNGTLTYDGIYDFNNGADLDFIKAEIDKGFPVIAKMSYLSTNHYVLICGYSDNTFFINDPWYENPARTINASYDPHDDPDNAIKGIVVFRSEGITPVKVPVRRVESIFKEPSDAMIFPMKSPEMVLHIGKPEILVDNKAKEIDPGKDTSPEIINDRTYIPMKVVIEEMGGDLKWDDKNKKITINVQGRTAELWIGMKTMFINGWEFEFDSVPVIRNSRTMVPMRLILEKLGLQVQWDEGTKGITIRAIDN